MACPLEINMHNLIGSFDMNKKIGDNTAPVLKMQGLSWIVRQAVSYSAIQVNLKQYTDDDGVVHIDQEQVSTGGVKQTELRVLNGEWAERDVDYWGFVTGWNKYAIISLSRKTSTKTMLSLDSLRSLKSRTNTSSRIG